MAQSGRSKAAADFRAIDTTDQSAHSPPERFVAPPKMCRNSPRDDQRSFRQHLSVVIKRTQTQHGLRNLSPVRRAYRYRHRRCDCRDRNASHRAIVRGHGVPHGGRWHAVRQSLCWTVRGGPKALELDLIRHQSGTTVGHLGSSEGSGALGELKTHRQPQHRQREGGLAGKEQATSIIRFVEFEHDFHALLQRVA